MISDWGALQTILAIAVAGNLSAAAKSLKVNQSTVSRRLRAIEDELGCSLFRRTRENLFIPTEAGEALVETARSVGALIGEAGEKLGNAAKPVRIASCEVLAKVIVAPTVAAWRKETGESCDLIVSDNLFTLDPESFDILITPMDSAPQDMTGKRIATLQWGLYASPGYLAEHPVEEGCETLDGHSIIQAAESLADIDIYKALSELGGTVAFRSSSPLTQADMAANGAGITLLPCAIADHDSRLLPIAAKIRPTNEVWMVARRAVVNQPKVRRFLDWGFARLRNAPSSTTSANSIARLQIVS